MILLFETYSMHSNEEMTSMRGLQYAKTIPDVWRNYLQS